MPRWASPTASRRSCQTLGAMNSGLAFAFGALGSLAGVAYAILGVVALKHLAEPTQLDRNVGWSLWWFVEERRYANEGRRLCRFGGVLFSLGALSWLAAFFIARS
jgi:hypothetical protein